MGEQEHFDEKAIIDKIVQRRTAKRQWIPAEQVAVFKEKLGEEIHRSGKLSEEFVRRLLEKLKNGEL